MFKKKILLSALAVALTVVIIAGASALASPGYGTEDDPLVTLSYINTTVKSAIAEDIEEIASAAKESTVALMDEQVKSLTSLFDTKLKNTTPVSTGDVFSVVSLSSGQTVSCSPGAEIMLRIGTAVSSGSSSPRLVDMTDGSSVAGSGSALVKNHLYMATIDGNGIKATAAAKILIRGTYKVS
ncbi:MAG: hypothetical protein AB7C97_10750 [Oscillospiraceae bacterium]